jgi:hypothetical protein
MRKWVLLDEKKKLKFTILKKDVRERRKLTNTTMTSKNICTYPYHIQYKFYLALF